MLVQAAIVLLVVTIILVLTIRRRRRMGLEARLLVSDWRPNLVYLAQFPPSPRVRSISPFSLKLETWLRLAKIPYQNVYTRKFSKASHTIPYIELNGQQISDSNRIMETLRSHFQAELDLELTAQQKATDHALTSMIENHTAQVSSQSGVFSVSSVQHHYYVDFQAIRVSPCGSFIKPLTSSAHSQLS